LRVYQAAPGKLAELLARFREHTAKLFDKHGMKNVAYWTAIDEPKKSNTLIYILEHPSREAAAANWESFQDDPEWKSVRDNSEGFEVKAEDTWTKLMEGFRQDVEEFQRLNGDAEFKQTSSLSCRISNPVAHVAALVTADMSAQTIQYTYEPEDTDTAVPEGG